MAARAWCELGDPAVGHDRTTVGRPGEREGRVVDWCNEGGSNGSFNTGVVTWRITRDVVTWTDGCGGER